MEFKRKLFLIITISSFLVNAKDKLSEVVSQFSQEGTWSQISSTGMDTKINERFTNSEKVGKAILFASTYQIFNKVLDKEFDILSIAILDGQFSDQFDLIQIMRPLELDIIENKLIYQEKLANREI